MKDEVKAKLAAASISSRFPAYAPASASILFPAFGLLQSGVISLVRLASSRSRTPAVKLLHNDGGGSLTVLG